MKFSFRLRSVRQITFKILFTYLNIGDYMGGGELPLYLTSIPDNELMRRKDKAKLKYVIL